MRYAFAITLALISAVNAQDYTAKYKATFLGVPLGEGDVKLNLNSNNYNGEISARAKGVGMIFAGGSALIKSNGSYDNNRLHGKSITADIKGKEQESFLMELINDNVTKFERNPKKDPHPLSVPILDEHKRNIYDPFAGAFVMAKSVETALTAQTCDKTHQIFSGQSRYDITLSYLRTEEIEISGYKGKAVVCAGKFSLISGYRTDKRNAEEAAKQPASFWLVPIAKSKIMVPYKIDIKTKFGLLIIEAEKLNIGY